MNYFNVNGDPLNVSARDAVLIREPRAYASYEPVKLRGCKDEPFWRIRRQHKGRAPHWSDTWLGSGFNEESAWRQALSEMRIQDDETLVFAGKPKSDTAPMVTKEAA
jgi:hypothetical protein